MDESSSDPAQPEQWRYYLNEEDANRLFSFRGDNRQVYDPWSYVRDAGNLNDVIQRHDLPDKHWIWQTNSLGCREDHELDNPARDFRVLVAGDSHTCGVCDDKDSFANVLEASLVREHAPKTIEVLNAGLGGYSFHNYLGTFFRLRKFEPQVFVVGVFGGNDFSELLMLDFQFKHRPWDSWSAREDERRKSALEICSEAMGQGFNAIDTFRAWHHEEPVVVRAAIDLCAEMNSVAAKHHSKLIIVFIPAPFDFARAKWPGRVDATRAALELSDADMQINHRMATSFLDGLREAGVQALDMRPIFEREPTPPYWLIDFHLNLRGHALVAQALEPLVEAALAVK